MISRTLGDDARSVLSGTRFHSVEWGAETGSTNADLLAAAAAAPEGEPVDGLVRVTDHQSAGRGRRGRTWVTEPEAALMVSVLVRPGPLGLQPSQLGRLTMAFGVAAADACRRDFGADVGLKWPNDVVSRGDDRKVAGILAESSSSSGRLDVVVIGMGLNTGGPLPAEVADRAVTLADLCGRPVDREALLVGVLRRFDELLDVVTGDQVAARYRRLSATIGRQVSVELEGGVVKAEAVDIDDDGHLLIDPGTGDLVPIAAGDVVHLRPL